MKTPWWFLHKTPLSFVLLPVAVGYPGGVLGGETGGYWWCNRCVKSVRINRVDR